MDADLFKNTKIDKVDRVIAQWMERNGYLFLRVSLGLIFIWFGALKPLGLSPAEGLITKTVYWVDPEIGRAHV